MRTLAATVALIALLGTVGIASAGPLDPPLGPAAFPGGQVAGEGAAPNGCILGTVAACNTPPGSNPAFRNPSAVLHLDWIVVNDGNPNGGWSYYYQLENSSVAGVASLTVSSGLFKAAGFISGADLDAGIPAGAVITPGVPPAAPSPLPKAVKGHNAGAFPNLATESELAGKCCTDPSSVAIIFGTHTTTWNFGLLVGEESAVLVGQGPNPGYFDWVASGGNGPQAHAWSNNFGNCTGVNTPLAGCPGAGEQGRQVAAPSAVTLVPEPATLLLLGTGLIGLGAVTRRAGRRK